MPIKYLASALLGLAVMVTSTVNANELVVSTAGGLVSETEGKVYSSAFEKETGWKVKRVSAEGSARMAQIEAMVQAGKMGWDISEISASNYPIGIARGLLEPIDYSKVDPSGSLPEIARQKYGVAVMSYSTVLVQRLDKNPAGKKIASWADFWDVKTFPGPRSLRNTPQHNLEFALLADGVDKADVYKLLSTPEGVDRAFAKLDKIKEHVPVWWDTGAQSVQLLSDQEVYYSTTYNGRITTLVESGVPAEIVWNGGALHVSYMSIPKGAPNIDMAHQYLRIRSTRPELGRKYMEVLAYPGFAAGLFDGMDQKLAKQMPTFPPNAKAQFTSDEDFWAKNLDRLQERWNEWLLR